jgi:DNA-binding transcriptional ArsR family regulator
VTPPLDRFDWERLVREIEMPPMTKLVALTLATFANGDGTKAHPGESKLAAACGMKERGVRNHVTALREAGLLKRVSRGGSMYRYADVYELHVPDDLPEKLAGRGWKLRHGDAGDVEPDDELALADPVDSPVDNRSAEHVHAPELRHGRTRTPARERRTPARPCRPPITYTKPKTKPLCNFSPYVGAVEGARVRDGPIRQDIDHFDGGGRTHDQRTGTAASR